MVDASITLTLSIELFKQRKAIYDMVAKPIIKKFDTDVVVIGEGNVGKTTYINQLTATLNNSRFHPTQNHSKDIEHALVRVNNKTRPKKIVIIPGQVSYESYADGLQEHLVSPSTTSGLIYMVDWGYRVPRTQDIQLLLMSNGIRTIEDLTEYNRKTELEHFTATMAQATLSNIEWIFIVINKTDLFHNKIGESINYYQQLFNPIINKYFNKIDIEFVPMTSVNHGLIYNGVTIPSITSPQYTQEMMLANFMEKLSTVYLKG
ncbi:TPA: GTPase domain-containing protein [Morganella morganii]